MLGSCRDEGLLTGPGRWDACQLGRSPLIDNGPSGTVRTWPEPVTVSVSTAKALSFHLGQRQWKSRYNGMDKIITAALQRMGELFSSGYKQNTLTRIKYLQVLNYLHRRESPKRNGWHNDKQWQALQRPGKTRRWHC